MGMERGFFLYRSRRSLVDYLDSCKTRNKYIETIKIEVLNCVSYEQI